MVVEPLFQGGAGGGGVGGALISYARGEDSFLYARGGAPLGMQEGGALIRYARVLFAYSRGVRTHDIIIYA